MISSGWGVEFRIPLPLNVEEFQIAQLFMVIKAQEKVTGGGEGITVLKNEPFDNLDGSMGLSEISKTPIPKAKGQYTLKKYFLSSMVPTIVKKMLPADALFLWEEAWNAHPYCLTVMTNGFLDKEKFKISVESVYYDSDKGDREGVLAVEGEEKREVVLIDVADTGDKKAGTLSADENVTVFHSEKRQYGPMEKGWYKDDKQSTMCCYKKCTLNFKYFMLENLIEGKIRKQQMNIFTRTMRQLICLMDEWHGLTLADIRQLEVENQAKLDKLITEGEVKDLVKESAAITKD